MSTFIPGPDMRPTAESPTRELAVGFGASLVMAGLIALSARNSFYLPFTDIPVSLQVFCVLLAGGLLGARWGAMAVVEYLWAGAMGLPVFTQGGGPQALLGPTGGYLMGFLLAATLVGYVSDRRARSWVLALSMLAGAGIILLCGGFWLHFALLRPWPVVLATGIMPFVAADALKALAAWAIVRRLRS